jgi:hypothetical protein
MVWNYYKYKVERPCMAKSSFAVHEVSSTGSKLIRKKEV